MANASKDTQFSDLGYGDETRRFGDYVGLPHDQDSGGVNDVLPGQVVSVGSGVIKQAGDGTEAAIGVLSNYDRSGDSGGPDDPGSIDQDQNANVKVGGVVKAEVESDVSEGEYLVAGDETTGVLSNSAPDTESRFLALSDAVEDDRYDNDGNVVTTNYAEVLIQ